MRRLLLVPLAAVLLTSCTALGQEPDGVEVVAAFYPLGWVAEQVSGEEVELLTTPGSEPHDVELTVRETALVVRADVLVHEAGFQPAVDAAVAENAEGRVVDAAEAVELMTVGESADEHTQGRSASADHEHESEDEDPHFWLDPILMADLGDAVAEELVALDPAHEERYRSNAADLRQRMELLERAYAEGLSGCERDTVVVSHDAFGYLERFGLRLEPIAGLSPSAEPSPADLARLQELIRGQGLTTVFAETLGSRKLADTLAADLGLRTRTLDPIEGVAAGSDDDYVSLMRRNLVNLRAANAC